MRTDLKAHEPTLLKFLEQGLIGVKTEKQKALLAQCVEATGLSRSVIKVYELDIVTSCNT